MPVPHEPPSTRRDAGLAVVTSLFVALVVLVVFILPAEHNLDPLGTGELLGIKGMAGYQVNAIVIQDAAYKSDQVEFPLEPFESIEYKYVLDQGDAVLFSWHAEGEVVYDLHSEEQGSDPEQAVSFATGRSTGESGTFVAPYSGIHGWFWENRGPQAVVVSLRTSGFYERAIVYGPGGTYDRVLSD